MVKKFIIVLLVLAASLGGYLLGNSKPVPQPEAVYVAPKPLDAGEFITILNQQRQSTSLQPLQTNYSLCGIAYARAIELVANHQEPLIGESYKHPGIEKYDSWHPGPFDEDIATFPPTDPALSNTKLLTGFLNSPPHKASLDNPDYSQGCAASYKDILDVVVGAPK